MEFSPEDDISGPSSISSDQASLCVIPDPEDSSDEDGFIYLDKSSLPATLNLSEQDRTVIVFHSVDEEYPANQDIVCQYIRPDGWSENHKDHICLFKVGCVTKNDAIFMVSLPSPCSDSIGRVIIPVDILPKDTTNLYQFCYMREYALLGASTPFQFTLPKFDSVCCTAIHVPQQPVVEEQASLIAERSANVLSLLKQTSIVTHCNGKTIQDIEYSSPSERHQSPINYRETQQLSDVERSGSQEKSRSNSRSNSDSTYSFLSSMEEPKQLSIATDTGCEVGLTSSQRFPRNNHFSHFASFEQGKDLMKGSSDDPSSCLKNHFGEINEEKKWFQEEYHSLLATTRKYAEDLATERSEKISLNGHLAELAISNKMLCSENARLNEELERRRQYETEQLKKHQLEKNELKSSLQNVSLENLSLLEEVRYLQSQSKLEKESDISLDKSSLEAQCDDFKKQDSDLSSRLSDFEVIRKCLETELEEELRAGQERDCYIAQLEQVKVNNLQMASNWLASTPNSSADGNTLLEMEENVNSTLEALECALKEMEVLRSRKAALNRVNRILRDEFVQKRYEWKVKMEKQAVESDSKVAELQRQIFDLQCTANAGRLSQCASYQYVGKWNEEQSQQSLVDQNREVAGAIESTKNEISCLDIQKAELEHDHTLQKFRKDRGVTKVINSTLLKNLQDARDEYKKLYTEKVRVEEKLLRLQQKVKTKKLCRAHQEISDAAPTRDNFLDNPVSSWWATIDELM